MCIRDRESTAQRWVRDYKKSEKLPFDVVRGRKKKSNKLNETHEEFLKSKLVDDCTMSLDMMISDLLDHFEGLCVSKSTLGRFLSDNVHFTFKKIRKEPIARNTEWMIDKRYDYVSLINLSLIHI